MPHMPLEEGRPKEWSLLDPQRICSECKSELFFVTYAVRILTLICYRCHHPVALSLTRPGCTTLAHHLDKKGP